MSWILSLYMLLLLSIALVDALIWVRLVRQVNERLPEEKRYSFSIFAWQNSAWSEWQFDLERQHRLLYPNSCLRFWHIVGQVLCILWLMFGFNLLAQLFEVA